MTEAFIATVQGRVQGVCFRYEARTKAAQLGLLGWVRNCADGTVEVLCEGQPEQIKRFKAWLRKGPPGAYVTDLRVNPVKPTGKYSSFSIAF
ncbi:MAG: acylphosphatase [Spirochaetales bacterium]|jgi:acylphosphatase|nr:acylphosphatase [Spirochaetales bacterium]